MPVAVDPLHRLLHPRIQWRHQPLPQTLVERWRCLRCRQQAALLRAICPVVHRVVLRRWPEGRVKPRLVRSPPVQPRLVRSPPVRPRLVPVLRRARVLQQVRVLRRVRVRVLQRAQVPSILMARRAVLAFPAAGEARARRVAVNSPSALLKPLY